MTAKKADTANTENQKTTMTFKRKKLVTVPLLKPKLDVPFFIQITGEVYTGKEIKAVTEAKKMDAAKIAPCINLETGEVCEIIVPSVLYSILMEEYSGHAYIGCGFEITKKPKVTGKDYHGFFVAELEL